MSETSNIATTAVMDSIKLGRVICDVNDCEGGLVNPDSARGAVSPCARPLGTHEAK